MEASKRDPLAAITRFAAASTAIFDDLESLIRFLLMAISRSQDYVKASRGVALTPTLDTVDVRAALQIADKCIKNQHADRKVVVHVLPPDLCPFVITDQQYLLENLLCLMSNAAKYRCVCVRVRVRVCVPARLDEPPLCCLWCCPPVTAGRLSTLTLLTQPNPTLTVTAGRPSTCDLRWWMRRARCRRGGWKCPLRTTAWASRTRPKQRSSSPSRRPNA